MVECTFISSTTVVRARADDPPVSDLELLEGNGSQGNVCAGFYFNAASDSPWAWCGLENKSTWLFIVVRYVFDRCIDSGIWLVFGTSVSLLIILCILEFTLFKFLRTVVLLI